MIDRAGEGTGAPLLAGLALLLLMGFGCAAPTGSPTGETEAGTEAVESALPTKVEQAVAVARELAADSEASETILERHGMSVEQFEELMYEISSDPEMRRAYNAAIAASPD